MACAAGGAWLGFQAPASKVQLSKQLADAAMPLIAAGVLAKAPPRRFDPTGVIDAKGSVFGDGSGGGPIHRRA